MNVCIVGVMLGCKFGIEVIFEFWKNNFKYKDWLD